MPDQVKNEMLNPGLPGPTITTNLDTINPRMLSKDHDCVILNLCTTANIAIDIIGSGGFQIPEGSHHFAYTNPHAQVGGIFVPKGASIKMTVLGGKYALCFIHAYEIK